MKPIVRWVALAVVAGALAGCTEKKTEIPKEYAPPPSNPKLKGGEPVAPPPPPPKSQ